MKTSDGLQSLCSCTPSCISNMSMDMVICYGKCVWYDTDLPTILTQNTDQLLLGLCFFLLADGRCRQMSVESGQVRLAAIGIKLHVMLLGLYV